MALLIPFDGKHPQVDPTAWLAPTATLIGDVRIGPRANIWFGAVLRADEEYIEIGEGTNLQDGVVAHTDAGAPVVIGPHVGVGHLALLHGTRVGAGCLIGMGAKLLSHSVIEERAFVAAGALVLERQRIASGHLAAGVPAKDRGPLTEEMAARVASSGPIYAGLADRYREAGI